MSLPITGVLGDAPNATTDVSINGTNNKVGTTWTLTAPTWSMTGVATSYQWYRDGRPIHLATGARYRVDAEDRGARLSVKVTGIREGYAARTATVHQDL